MADKETSTATCTKNTVDSAGPQNETKKFVDPVNCSPTVPAGDHCSVLKSEKPSSPGHTRLSFLFCSGEICFPSLVSREIKQTRISTKRSIEPHIKKERGGPVYTDASTCDRGLYNDTDTLSIVRNQLETVMGLVPIETELKSACDA